MPDLPDTNTLLLSLLSTLLGGGWIKSAYQARRRLKTDARSDTNAAVIDTAWHETIDSLRNQLIFTNTSITEAQTAHREAALRYEEASARHHDQVISMRERLNGVHEALINCQQAHIEKDRLIAQLTLSQIPGERRKAAA